MNTTLKLHIPTVILYLVCCIPPHNSLPLQAFSVSPIFPIYILLLFHSTFFPCHSFSFTRLHILEDLIPFLHSLPVIYTYRDDFYHIYSVPCSLQFSCPYISFLLFLFSGTICSLCVSLLLFLPDSLPRLTLPHSLPPLHIHSLILPHTTTQVVHICLVHCTFLSADALLLPATCVPYMILLWFWD